VLARELVGDKAVDASLSGNLAHGRA
jgi:hypothetical protein